MRPVGVAIDNVQIQTLAGQPVITGKAVDLGGPVGKFFSGRRVWVPLAQVMQLSEFQSVADLKKTTELEHRGEQGN